MTGEQGRGRAEYGVRRLEEEDADPDPIRQFSLWFEEAAHATRSLPGAGEVNAMTLATADRAGAPSARIVLLRGFDERGFVFYTNYDSRKSTELTDNPAAALVLYWPAVERQVRIAGSVARVARNESEAYWHGRPRGSQLGAWASLQSAPISGRAGLEARLEELVAANEGREVPLPPFWGGWRLSPIEIELWQGRPNRLHDRLRYRLGNDGLWIMERLAP